MALTCIDNKGNRLVSVDFSETQWQSLKSSYKKLDIRMGCCQAPAIPKTSKTGLHFFSHKSDSCGGGKESIEHLTCKEKVMHGARQVGWEAFPEEEGIDNKGNKWIADVLCMKSNIKIAFEIQLSNQTFDEYKSRNQRYADSGIRCCWLVKRKRKPQLAEQMVLDRLNSKSRKDLLGQIPDRKDLPLFHVDVTNINNIFVFFPFRSGKGPLEIPLDQFVSGCLSGQLKFENDQWKWQT
jgi:competence protein CoiA